MIPKVSVVMAVFNGERYLPQAIDSVLNQTFADFELIIVDDASTDSTASILAAYAVADARISLLTNPENIGLTRSLNRGLHAARGDFIARMDADDLSPPYRLDEQVAFMEAHPEVSLLSGYVEVITAQGESLGVVRRATERMLLNWFMMFYNHVGGHSQVMFRRQAALQLGGYDENHRYSQDYDLWLRLMQVGEFVMLPRVWIQWRKHDESISHQQKAEQERLGLIDSQTQITTLLGREISLADVGLLRGFWLEPFPQSQLAPAVHRLLREIFYAFRQREGLSPADTRKIRHHAGERFMLWAQSISIRRNPRAKLHVLRYALIWHPGQLLKTYFLLKWRKSNPRA